MRHPGLNSLNQGLICTLEVIYTIKKLDFIDENKSSSLENLWSAISGNSPKPLVKILW